MQIVSAIIVQDHCDWSNLEIMIRSSICSGDTVHKEIFSFERPKGGKYVGRMGEIGEAGDRAMGAVR